MRSFIDEEKTFFWSQGPTQDHTLHLVVLVSSVPFLLKQFFLSLSFMTLVFWESRSQVFCRICLDLDLDLSDLTSGSVQDRHFWQEHHEVMLCIRRHTTWVCAIAGHVTLHDLVRVACLAGVFILMVLRNCLPRKPMPPATRAWAIPIFLPPAHKVSVLVARLPPHPLLLSCHLQAFSLWF